MLEPTGPIVLQASPDSAPDRALVRGNSVPVRHPGSVAIGTGVR